MVISDLKLANGTALHCHSQKPDDDLGARPNKDLAFASLFGAVDTRAHQQDIHAHRSGGRERWRKEDQALTPGPAFSSRTPGLAHGLFPLLIFLRLDEEEMQNTKGSKSFRLTGSP